MHASSTRWCRDLFAEIYDAFRRTSLHSAAENLTLYNRQIYGFDIYVATSKPAYRDGRDTLVWRILSHRQHLTFADQIIMPTRLFIDDLDLDALPESLPLCPLVRSVTYAPHQMDLLHDLVDKYQITQGRHFKMRPHIEPSARFCLLGLHLKRSPELICTFVWR